MDWILLRKLVPQKHLALLMIITRYELNCKKPEVAQSYLDLAVRIDPEETLVGAEAGLGRRRLVLVVVVLLVVVVVVLMVVLSMLLNGTNLRERVWLCRWWGPPGSDASLHPGGW